MDIEKVEGKIQSEEQIKSNKTIIDKIISIIQIVGGIVGSIITLFILLQFIVNPSGTPLYIVALMILLLLYVFSIYAGIRLWKQYYDGISSSIILQLFQIIQYTFAGISFMFISGIGLLPFNRNGWVGNKLQLGAKNYISLDIVGGLSSFSINLIPVLLIVYLLYRYIKRKDKYTVSDNRYSNKIPLVFFSAILISLLLTFTGNPNNRKWYYMTSKIDTLITKKDVAKANEEALILLKHAKKTYAPGHLNIGESYFLLGETQSFNKLYLEAAKSFNQAGLILKTTTNSNLYKKMIESYFYQGINYQHAENHEEALNSFNEGILVAKSKFGPNNNYIRNFENEISKVKKSIGKSHPGKKE